MEVMPSILSKRFFPAPATHQQLDPGYRDAPDPGRNCVIVFSRVCVLPSAWSLKVIVWHMAGAREKSMMRVSASYRRT